MYRVNSMQAQTWKQHRYHWPAVGGPYPVWTVFSPETRIVAGTKLLENVLPFLNHKGRKLFQHVEQAVLISGLSKLNFSCCVFCFRGLIQSVKEGDASLCPDAGELMHTCSMISTKIFVILNKN